ncbi:MAG: hypothetical protein HF314_15790 [Ignavibacteria bacterium]|jgi:hypothetical protein|nr:hypothetical protein [Ignavibacteria bacterium]MCU7504542.1 hypothetical protein [Ignavibacteria bacterium]MCU7516620.1 hypothetical protein [Ignavibacteria bacterium]
MKQAAMAEVKPGGGFDENGYSYIFKSNGLEEEIDRFKESKLKEIRFSVVTKHILFSLLALFLSFFLDLAYVPILGNISINIAKSIFPNWSPINQSFSSISFWWMPVVTYLFFLLFAYKAYGELRREVKQSTSADIIDRIIGSSISVIDGIATALPLIGAAILLISIKLGPEVFLGLSVPFEIKALIVLALGKLFEPVLDELSIEFQHVINRANELKNRYYAQTQIEHFQKVIDQLTDNTKMANVATVADYMPLNDLKQYEEVYVHMAELSRQMHQNISSTHEMMDKMNRLQAGNSQKLGELRNLAEAVANASNALKDEKALKALESIEAILSRR